MEIGSRLIAESHSYEEEVMWNSRGYEAQIYGASYQTDAPYFDFVIMLRRRCEVYTDSRTRCRLHYPAAESAVIKENRI